MSSSNSAHASNSNTTNNTSINNASDSYIPAAASAMLSPLLPGSSNSSSPIQSATSPRLMPSKSRPTTALVFEQLPSTLSHHHANGNHSHNYNTHDTESLSSDEFVLSKDKDKDNNKYGTSPSATATLAGLKGLAVSGANLPSTQTSGPTDLNSDSGEDDGRLTDTESDGDRTGTPVIAGRPMAANEPEQRSALRSLKEIEEHDKDDLQSHGMARYGSPATDSDQGDGTPARTLDHVQIQNKLKVITPKTSSRPSSRLRRTASNHSYDSDDISNNHGGYQKHYGNEDHTTSNWTAHRKHFFILSSAGKPIYARYGDESRISSYMGVIQALISFFADNDDSLRCINAGQHKFVFLLKPPLYLVCVSRSGESESQLRDQLGYLYSQIISVLTHSQMTRIFEQRNNFDLRGLIGGTEIFLDSLGKLMNTYPGFMLGAIQCLTMPRELRDKVGAVLGRAKCKPLLYAILLTPTQLITLLRPRTHSMHPSDLHLIFNLLSGSTTFESSESWTPICLPKFNNKSFLHAYICYIAKKVCMLLISPDKDSFFEMSTVKEKVVEELEAGGMLASLESYAAAGPRGGFTVGDTGIPGLRHFLYKSRTNVQFTMPELTDPYTSLTARKRLMRQYQHMNERMHRKTRPLKLLFHVGEFETMLGWITSGFELYAAFGPMVSKSAVVLMSNKLLKWIRKQEDSLLILNSPSFEKFK
ncbi:Vacuolar fusion protein mon1b [Mortierella antarctica]|nr:Vacuolar fusion protein mon1b [Mortierella antarctica]KAG0353030.1 Vacuolar fusion protein mon1b [Podila minutissima]